jgi:hypothetical protein
MSWKGEGDTSLYVIGSLSERFGIRKVWCPIGSVSDRFCI